jgi:hypothetical protein
LAVSVGGDNVAGMTSAQYDISKKQHSQLIWIESAHGLAFAKKRIRDLAEQNGHPYVVYDQRARLIVASCEHDRPY